MIKKFEEFININKSTNNEIQKPLLKEDVSEYPYLSDEDIHKQYEDFKISEFSIKPRRLYHEDGYTWDISFGITFPNADHEDFDETSWENVFVYDEKGKRMAFDHWYPEDIAIQLVQMVRDEIQKHWSELNDLKNKDNHKQNTIIDENIDFEQINESFNNKELAEEIKKHGGLKDSQKDMDARRNLTTFDLKNSKYSCYLNPKIVSDIYYNNAYMLLYKSKDIILYTNDGGIILIDSGDDKDNYRKWRDKMHMRNDNWIEDRIKENPEETFWNVNKTDDSTYRDPHSDVTGMRRFKHTNRNHKN